MFGETVLKTDRSSGPCLSNLYEVVLSLRIQRGTLPSRSSQLPVTQVRLAPLVL